MAKTSKKDVSNLSVEERLAAVEASVDTVFGVVRKIAKALKSMFNIDTEKDGRVSIPLLMAIGIVSIGLAFAGTSTIWDISSSFGHAKVQSDGSQMTMTVDKLVVTNTLTVKGVGFAATIASNDNTNVSVSNLAVKGDATITGNSTLTGFVSSPIVSNAAGVVYGSNLTVKAGGTVTVPAGSVAAASIAAGTLGSTVRINSLIVSNVNGVAVCSNVVVWGSATFNTTPIYDDGLAAGTLCYTGATKTLMLR